jgi:seryl-tRNA synthetase
MYDIKWIREHPDAFDRGLKRRGLEPLSRQPRRLMKSGGAITNQSRRRRAGIRVKGKQATPRRAMFSRANADGRGAELKTSLPKMAGAEGVRRRTRDGTLRNSNAPADDVPGVTDAMAMPGTTCSEKARLCLQAETAFDAANAGQMDLVA